MKHFWKHRWILFAFILYFSVLIWSNRSSFFKKFDSTYWQSRYDSSQWKLLNSKRIIGDSGLYEIEGYNLTKGADPSLLNPEVPPLGKYLIGYSIVFFGNASVYGALLMIVSFVSFYWLLYLTTASGIISALATLVVFSDPLIAMQFTAPMMDMLQLCFILISGIILMQFQKVKRSSWDYLLSCILGMCIGFFSLSKFPMLAVPFFLESIIQMQSVWKDFPKKWLIAFSYALGVIASYGLVYSRYFMMGHTVLDWMALQKWIINIYMESKLQANIGSIITTLIGNTYQDLFSKQWVHPEAWSFTWPILTACFITSILLLVCNLKNKVYPPYLFFSICAIASYACIPFWTRYLVLVLPLFYFLTVVLIRRFFKEKQVVWILIMFFVCNVFFLIQILVPKPQGVVEQFARDWKFGFFQDMYERIDTQSLQGISREEFHRTGQKFWYDGQIEEADVVITSITWNMFALQANADLEITYKTRSLGSFIEKTEIPLILRDNQWYVVWDWGNFIYGLSKDSSLETIVKFGKRGTVYNRNVVVAQDIPSLLISIIPNKVDVSKEDDLLTLLQEVFYNRLVKSAIHYRYVGNSQADWPIPIGVIPTSLGDNEIMTRIDMLRNIQGVTFTNAISRYPSLLNNDVKNVVFDECCSLLYSPTSYRGVIGFEKKFDTEISGSDGGSLTIQNQTSEVVRVIKESEPIMGNDITVGSLE